MSYNIGRIGTVVVLGRLFISALIVNRIRFIYLRVLKNMHKDVWVYLNIPVFILFKYQCIVSCMSILSCYKAGWYILRI